jgi:hypothetical protein
VGYFGYVLATAAAVRVPAARLRYAADLALLTLALMGFAIALEPSPVASVLRDWLPGLYLLLGYWATGALYRGPRAGLERRLAALDHAVFARVGPGLLRVPRLALELLEFAYLLCYPLVPLGLATLYLAGQRHNSGTFWTVVLLAAYGSYGMLPWLGTRPPRALGQDVWMERRQVSMRRVNLRVLDRGSITVNTFPSGHAASAVAIDAGMRAASDAKGSAPLLTTRSVPPKNASNAPCTVASRLRIQVATAMVPATLARTAAVVTAMRRRSAATVRTASSTSGRPHRRLRASASTTSARMAEGSVAATPAVAAANVAIPTCAVVAGRRVRVHHAAAATTRSSPPTSAPAASARDPPTSGSAPAIRIASSGLTPRARRSGPIAAVSGATSPASALDASVGRSACGAGAPTSP